MKKTFTLTCLILASIIGAGFASGKEIQVFFTQYGYLSFLSIIITFFIFYILIKLYLNYGKEHNAQSILNVNKTIFPKFHKLLNLFYLICCFIVLAGMFAGVFELYLNITNVIWAKVFVVITILLCVIANAGGIKFINAINNILMPITMIILFIIAIKNLNFNNPVNYSFSNNNIVKSVFSLITYVGMNVMLAGSVLLRVGHKFSDNNIKKSAFFSSLILTLIIFLFNLVMLFNNVNSQMPMLTFAFKLSKFWGLIVLFSIWFCIYSSATSLTFSLSKCINLKNNIISILIVVSGAYLISLIGFNKIVAKLYPLIGLFGLLVSIKLFLKSKQTFNTMQSSKNQPF